MFRLGYLAVLILAYLAPTQGQEGGCLSCGTECLSSVQTAVPVCIAAGFDITQAMVGCVSKVVDLAMDCQTCIKSLVCCVTDSCSLCDCSCASLLQFRAPVASRVFQEYSWLLQPQCHFAYIGNPACDECEGKNVYKSINCSQSVFLHYHDYFIDGRWVLTTDLNGDDSDAVVRNLGDGLDDEECPEKENYNWEMRSKAAPAVGWLPVAELKLEPFISEKELKAKAKLLKDENPAVLLLAQN